MIVLLGAVSTKAGDSTDEQLRAMCLNDSTSFSQAIVIATRQQNVDLLVYAMNTPSYGLKIETINAMTMLPHDKAKAALLGVLRMDQIWQHKYTGGGEYRDAQDTFNNTLKGAVLKVLNIDFSVKDLFVPQNRKDLIDAIQAGS